MDATDSTEKAFAAARARWPEIHLARAQFAAFVEAGRVGGAELAAHGDDLFLACACAAGDAVALRVFESGPLAAAAAALARFFRNRVAEDEALQRTRVKLLVGARPLIATYAGAGSLASWTRVCALRVAIDARPRPPAPADLEPAFLPGRSAAAEPPAQDHRLDVEAFRARLGAATYQALAALTPDDRSLLRLHFFDGLTVDQLAVVLRVHRATAARRLVAIRRRVLDATRRQMEIDFGTTARELDSLWRAFGDEIKLSLSRLL